MQPTYLPWLGYFALIDRADKFVFLDTVQFARRSWQQRNRIKTADGPKWLTVPVLSKGKRDQYISETCIDDSRNFPAAHIRALELNYSKAPFYSEYAPKLFSVMDNEHEKICDLTIALISHICDEIGINTPLSRSSELDAGGTKTDLLADICGKIGADHYISAPGSKTYIEESSAFDDAGIMVSYNDYSHPTYDQRFGDFEASMSIVDLLLNVGPESLSVVRQGCRVSV